MSRYCGPVEKSAPAKQIFNPNPGGAGAELARPSRTWSVFKFPPGVGNLLAKILRILVRKVLYLHSKTFSKKFYKNKIFYFCKTFWKKFYCASKALFRPKPQRFLAGKFCAPREISKLCRPRSADLSRARVRRALARKIYIHRGYFRQGSRPLTTVWPPDWPENKIFTFN